VEHVEGLLKQGELVWGRDIAGYSTPSVLRDDMPVKLTSSLEPLKCPYIFFLWVAYRITKY